VTLQLHRGNSGQLRFNECASPVLCSSPRIFPEDIRGVTVRWKTLSLTRGISLSNSLKIIAMCRP